MAVFPPVPAVPRTKIELPPQGPSLDIDLTVDQKYRRYVEEWFDDEKTAGDTLQKFILRVVYSAAISHRSQKLLAVYEMPSGADPKGNPNDLVTIEDQRENYRYLLSQEEGALIAAVEGDLP